jgi:hypothetical protein
VEIPNPDSGCEFPEVLVEIQRWVWISRGHMVEKASAAFFYVHKLSIYANEQKARKQQPEAASTYSCI